MNNTTSQSSKPVSILLAEDDREMRRMLSGILAREGYIVEPCADGMQLLERLESHGKQAAEQRYDLVVSDVRMPGFTGLEILDYIHENGNRPPVLLITAFGDERTHQQAEVYGAAGILDKPFDIDEFSKTVAEILWEQRATTSDLSMRRALFHPKSEPPVEVVFHGISRHPEIETRVQDAVGELQSCSPPILHCRVVLSGKTNSAQSDQCVARGIVTLPGKVFVVDGSYNGESSKGGMMTCIDELFLILEGRIRKHYGGVEYQPVTPPKRSD